MYMPFSEVDKCIRVCLIHTYDKYTSCFSFIFGEKVPEKKNDLPRSYVLYFCARFFGGEQNRGMKEAKMVPFESLFYFGC